MEKYCRAVQVTDDSITRRMRIAWRVNKWRLQTHTQNI